MIDKSGAKSSHHNRKMTRTYTEQALLLVDRQLAVAARDGGVATCHGLKFTPKGYVLQAEDGRRIGKADAVQVMATYLEAADAPAPAAPAAPRAKGEPRRTGFIWDSLNQATQGFFFQACEDIQEVTRDHSMTLAVQAKDVRVGLVNAPRLTNLKKAGLIETIQGDKKSHKFIRLTDAGRAIWFAHCGG